jgi:hypothetical protein
MANPYSSTTSGGSAGQSVYNDVSSIERRRIVSQVSSDDAAIEEQQRKKINDYIVVLKALDQEALRLLDEINDRKISILTIINNARSKVSTRNAYVRSIETAQSNPVASKIVDVGFSTFRYDCQTITQILNVGTAIQTTVCNVGVRAPVYPDILVAWQYPNIESLVVDVDFYKQDEGYVSVTNQNLGIGVTILTFGEESGVTGSIGLKTTFSSPLGTYYYFTNIDSITPGASSEISALVNEIESLRGELNTFLVGIGSGVNEIRALKSKTQVDLWFDKKGQQTQQTTILPSYSGTISSLENDRNSSIIQNYNA